jgi:hypothetical protein
VVSGKLSHFSAEREATRAVLTAVIIRPVERRINLTFLMEHCPSLFQLAAILILKKIKY